MNKSNVNTKDLISQKCDQLKQLLISKNIKYGDSALFPLHLFSKQSNLEQLNVRIDDKLNRIINKKDNEDEDVYFDLTGYLILYMIARDLQENNNKTENNNKSE